MRQPRSAEEIAAEFATMEKQAREDALRADALEILKLMLGQMDFSLNLDYKKLVNDALMMARLLHGVSE